MVHTRTEILLKFKKLLTDFCEELIDQFPSEADFQLAKVILDSQQIPIQRMMNSFIKHMNKDDKLIRKMVDTKNELFFTEENPFGFMSNSRFDKFSQIWKSGVLDDEDKAVLWTWIETFVKLSDKYNDCEVD